MESREETRPIGLTEHQIKDYRKSFDIIDANKDGKLSKEELLSVWYLLGFNLTRPELDRMMKAADANGDGNISFEEYLKIATKNKNFMQLEEEISRMKTAFSVFDSDLDGYISKAEFSAALSLNNEYITPKDIDDFFREMDINDDGKININEFVEAQFCCSVI